MIYTLVVLQKLVFENVLGSLSSFSIFPIEAKS